MLFVYFYRDKIYFFNIITFNTPHQHPTDGTKIKNCLVWLYNFRIAITLTDFATLMCMVKICLPNVDAIDFIFN
jgi:hypothetical protein